MGARRVLPLVLCLGLVGCGGSTPSASPSGQAAIATATPALTLTPTATPVAPTARPTPKPTPQPPAWTKRERAIRNAIRDDVRVGCAPRRQDLPQGTIAAVECQPDGSPASRVGFYLFATRGDALDVYLKRVREEGLRLNRDTRAGWEHCQIQDTGGVYTPLDCPDREATFVNSDGYANYRATKGRLYIGVLGTRGDTGDLLDWTRTGGGNAEGVYPDTQTLWCFGAAPSAEGGLCPDGLNDGGVGG